MAHFVAECCFQVIYFNSNISFVDPIETSLAAGVETLRLTHAVKNAWVRRQTGVSEWFAQAFVASVGAGEVENLMSMRIAVALAATIGAGVLMSQAAEARPEMVGVRGDYTPGTIVVTK